MPGSRHPFLYGDPLEDFVSRYGYFAIFILTFFEGESVLIAAGLLAYHGYLNALAVILVATTASFVGHASFFLIALYKREAFLTVVQRFIRVNVLKLESLVARYGVAAIFITQWIYGFRLLSAAVLGLSRMGGATYFPYQFVSCLLWAVICTIGGYFFGATLTHILGELKHYSVYIAIGVMGAGFVIWLMRDVWRKK